MTVIQGYTQSVLLPQLRSLALSKRQREIVLEDVSRRLESLLFHWNDRAFRRTILMLGTEEATFWEPQAASLEIRSLVVVAVRNSLIEDLAHPSLIPRRWNLETSSFEMSKCLGSQAKPRSFLKQRRLTPRTFCTVNA